jgi:Ohr subfamily peroxiredoxin
MKRDRRGVPAEDGAAAGLALAGEEQLMAVSLPRILYTAEAAVQGGREGHGRTSDGRLEVDLSVPKEMSGDGGPGTNPEQLFAVGYAACFQSALLGVAQGRGLDVSGSQINSKVGIGPTGHGGFSLAVSLDLHAPGLPGPDAAELMARAHERCPYSNATRGNIEVTLTVDGISLEQAAGTAAS